MLKAPLALSICFFSSLACAQTSADYNGTWSARLLRSDGRTLDAELVISGDSGTWKLFGRNNANNCLNRPFPLSVTTALPDELVFKVSANEVVPGCGNNLVTLRRIDAKSLKGSFGDTDSVQITRDKP